MSGLINENSKIFTVYMHRNKINDKRYIGMTCQKPERRWGSTGNGYMKDYQPYIQHAIEKYGWDNFEHHILAPV